MTMRALILSVAALASLPYAALADETPATKLTLEDRADVYMARKMYREAIDTYKDAEKTASDKAILEDKIGIAWHQLGDAAAALKSYQRAVKLDSKYADAINNIGTIYYAQKRYRRAINEYRKALNISPNSAAIWSNLGTAQYARKQFQEMSESYAKALQLDPAIFEARAGAGTQMQDRAVEDRARYHFEMARVYAKAGKNDIALQYLRRSLEEGFSDKAKIEKDPEFAALKETPEFKDLMTLEPRVL